MTCTVDEEDSTSHSGTTHTKSINIHLRAYRLTMVLRSVMNWPPSYTRVLRVLTTSARNKQFMMTLKAMVVADSSTSKLSRMGVTSADNTTSSKMLESHHCAARLVGSNVGRESREQHLCRCRDLPRMDDVCDAMLGRFDATVSLKDAPGV